MNLIEFQVSDQESEHVKEIIMLTQIVHVVK